MEIVGFILVGAIAGWLSGRVMRGHGFGLIGDVIVGVIGAFIGGYIFGVAGVELGGLAGTLALSFVGALLLLFIVRLFTGRRKGRKIWS